MSRSSPPAPRPVVAVVAAGPGATDPLRPLVRALASHVEVRSADRSATPAAYLVAGAAALGTVPDDVPVAVAEDGRLVIGRGEGAVDVDLPAGVGVDSAAWPPVPPHVRRRWRARLGLADDLVVDVRAIDPDDVPTALTVAAAAVVPAAHLPLALALGCPAVTTASAAAAVGAVDGLHVVVGDRAAADALAGDDRRCALLSRQGRHLAVTALDPRRAAEALVRGWDLAPTGPVARLDQRLSELGTAPASPVRRRVAEAVAALPPVPVALGGP
ncbi:hypothetical protein HC251_09155 [Iamia sp. SCSIO 61187]|uniref:hypothetical protein n=1 Tax=Iamia sp. SCSIO 61187 TaxID=2722752 RepID=UPI001C63918A|nr:hypothetical protein [Iamia sp. SCSIO 61187]QYG92587.1 hypothetical protein HC251_09155 [Iamia sp. SCSIO 61187]